MRRAHLVTGILTVILFLVTGQVMRYHNPPLNTLDPATRLLFRSRHIYLLAGGLVNSMLGLYWQPRKGWRRAVQTAGSVLLLASPALLAAAFFIESELAFRPGEMWWSSLGLYLLFGGSALHLACYHR